MEPKNIFQPITDPQTLAAFQAMEAEIAAELEASKADVAFFFSDMVSFDGTTTDFVKLHNSARTNIRTRAEVAQAVLTQADGIMNEAMKRRLIGAR